jgi:hypothetical protein
MVGANGRANIEKSVGIFLFFYFSFFVYNLKISFKELRIILYYYPGRTTKSLLQLTNSNNKNKLKNSNTELRNSTIARTTTTMKNETKNYFEPFYLYQNRNKLKKYPSTLYLDLNLDSKIVSIFF